MLAFFPNKLIKSSDWRIVGILFLFICLQLPETSQLRALSTNLDRLRSYRKQWENRLKQSYSNNLNVGNFILDLKGGADEDSEQNLIGDLVLDDIEGRTLEQEIEALERELEEAQDSRAVAEQVCEYQDVLRYSIHRLT
jgi:hypothetical protein